MRAPLADRFNPLIIIGLAALLWAALLIAAVVAVAVRL